MHGRSLSEEIERRLEQSIDFDDHQRNVFGGENTLRVMIALASLASVIEAKAGTDWLDDEQTFRQVLESFGFLLGAFNPVGAEQKMDTAKNDPSVQRLGIAKIVGELATELEKDTPENRVIGQTMVEIFHKLYPARLPVRSK